MTLGLDELRRLEREAVPGPWLAGTDGRVEAAGGRGVFEALYPRPEANALLTVAARNALPGLLDRLEAAERLLGAHREYLESLCAPHCVGRARTCRGDMDGSLHVADCPVVARRVAAEKALAATGERMPWTDMVTGRLADAEVAP